MSRRKRQKVLEDVNVFDLVPVRRAAWEEKDGRVVVERPRPDRRSLGAVFEWLGFYMSVPKIRLDEKGSETWKLLDGNRTVSTVVRDMRERFGDEVEPAEERVGRVVQVFHQEDLISYLGWDGEGVDAAV